ncbi:Rieske (2Fe-2S) protein [Candidatus Venteria ishoeyi]|uniref:Benzene 1,2-dioxygenase system ferredoxin subunit n=1 Tax=Candidatus Venteria ishoeyi TaxID=1899563 RepID=A0A1H6F5V6_9GAMM|nr:non-heme iron oxygenase ferredoxin subunit [Candidatus Venteria ishoeyi]MDM8546024.1 non-heme iron oxygenase ferredoxin subunit [Candidatus Venteria ishoeyi]SEH05558.1 Benzene 1%2C2-dioxygenase system ferredoxin subunit [Candidatus Venteria ishoeyi]
MKWYRVAHADECPPGKMLRVEIAGKRILIAHVEGVFYALDDTCTHEDASLYTGCLKGKSVKCPLHGSYFSLATGQPSEEPAEEPLQTYAIKQEGEALWIESMPENAS